MSSVRAIQEHGYKDAYEKNLDPLIQAGGSLFETRAFVTALPKYATPTSLAFRIAWA